MTHRPRELLRDRRVRIGLAIVLGILLLWFIPTGQVVSVPGAATDVASMIRTPMDGTTSGQIMLTTVISQEANVLLWVAGRMYPRAELRPLTAQLLPGEDFDEYLERTREMMRESQQVAKVVALRTLGYTVEARGEGVRVFGIRAESPARDLLQPGDIIVGADGLLIQFTDELLSFIRGYQPGDTIVLDVLREDVQQQVEVSLMLSPEDEMTPVIGISVVTENPSFVFPLELEIDAGRIGGPSAGLAFTLGLIDQLTPSEALFRSLKVACTGTVSLNGSVGPVGGVRLKAYAAQRAGADLFLVPKENYDEAVRAHVDFPVIAVDSVEAALAAIRNHVIDGG